MLELKFVIYYTAACLPSQTSYASIENLLNCKLHSPPDSWSCPKRGLMIKIIHKIIYHPLMTTGEPRSCIPI